MSRATTSGPVLWVASQRYLTGFDSFDTGNIAPTFIVEGSKPNIESSETATDKNGWVYVMGHVLCGQSSCWQISKFRPDSNGNVKPTDTLNCGEPDSGEAFFAVGSDGRLAVNSLGQVGPYIDIAPSGSSGCSKGFVTIQGSNTEIGLGVALGPHGAIYAIASPPNEIIAFTKGASGNTAPSRTIAGPHTKLNGPLGIAVDSAGKIYAANLIDNSVTVYRPTANGDANPIQRIMGPNTQLYYPDAISVSPDGRIFVANFMSNAITVYATGASGDVSPIQEIGGSATGLQIQGEEEQISVASQ